MIDSKGLASAAPSLFCLVPLFFLPYFARKSLNVWRALQVYDRQPITEKPESKEKKSWTAKAAALLPGPLIVLFLFSGFMMDWDEQQGWLSLLAQFRSMIPLCLYFLIILPATFVLTSIFRRNTTTHLSRRWNADKGVVDSLRTMAAPLGWVPTHCCVVSSLAIVWASRDMMPQSIPYIAASAGTIFWTSIHWTPPVFRRCVSFRGMVMFPALFGLYTAVLMTAFFMIVLPIALLVVYLDKKGSQDESSSKSDTPLGKDVIVEQFLAIYYPSIFSIFNYFSASLASLAYRYDVAQVGKAIVSDEEADQILAESKQQQETGPKTKETVKDTLGRIPIRLDTASLPLFAVSAKELPTFYTAMGTLIAVQVVGVFIDYTTAWQKIVIFPLNKAQIPDFNMAISVWPLLGSILTLITMMIIVSMRSDRSFKSLWTYCEKWEQESKAEQSKNTERDVEGDAEVKSPSDEDKA